MQKKLIEYFLIPHLFIPMRREYACRKGLAERVLRTRLEQQGWTTWRAGSIGAHKLEDAYPSVKRKYALLERLMHTECTEELEYLARVHHGMPDFLCHRRGEWKFVECKLCHEQLSERQKRCIATLIVRGFVVEVHKLVDERTKTRRAAIDISTGEKRIHERQLRLKRRY